MIKEVFDRWAETYDRARRQLIPCFDDFYQAALGQISFPDSAKIRVLDLGAGTGLLSLFVSQRFPDAEITLIDLSDAMLAKARRRFVDRPGRFTFFAADYLREAFPGRFDAVISALSIHHLTGDRKRALFGKVYEALTEGGVFINADQVLGATPEIEKAYRSAWLRQVRERGVSDDDLAAAQERMKEDQMDTLASQLTWLQEVGFREVGCWFQEESFAVFGGRK